MGPTLALLALALPTADSFDTTIALFFVLTFTSATHDIAADGLYMLAPRSSNGGVRRRPSFFWRVALPVGEGAGSVCRHARPRSVPERAWSLTLLAERPGCSFGATLLQGAIVSLRAPHPSRPQGRAGSPCSGSRICGRSLFFREGIVAAILFLVFYRFAETQ